MSALDLLFQQLINGLIKGSLYAMIALGYTMVYGILGIINFAHGEVFMIGAMVAMTMTTYLLTVGVSPVLALVCAILVAMMASMAVSLMVERFAYRPLRHAPRLAPLITAIGMSFILQALAMLVWVVNTSPSRKSCPLPASIYSITSASPNAKSSSSSFRL